MAPVILATSNYDPLPVEKTYNIELEVYNILISKGKINIAIYNNAKDFMKIPYIKKSVSLQQLQSGKLVFGNVPEGDYCITIYQDLNENGQLDKVLNMPTEPYGLSNNPNGFPTYDNTKFHVNQNTTIKIKLSN